MSDCDTTNCYWFTEVPDSPFPGKNVSTFNCNINSPAYNAEEERQMVNNGFSFCPFCGKPIVQNVFPIENLLA